MKTEPITIQYIARIKDGGAIEFSIPKNPTYSGANRIFKYSDCVKTDNIAIGGVRIGFRIDFIGENTFFVYTPCTIMLNDEDEAKFKDELERVILESYALWLLDLSQR